MTRLSCLVAALTALPLFSPVWATAGDSPFIWRFSKSSDTAYSAQIGSHLSAGKSSSVGAEIRMRGPDPREFTNPVTLWGAATLAEPASSGDGRSTRLEARIDGAGGKRGAVLNNTMTKSLPGVDARLAQEYTLDYEPEGNREVRARTTQSVRLSSPRTRTVVHMRTSRAHDGEWATSVGVEQPLRKGINLSATVDDPSLESRKGRFRASYRHTW